MWFIHTHGPVSMIWAVVTELLPGIATEESTQFFPGRQSHLQDLKMLHFPWSMSTGHKYLSFMSFICQTNMTGFWRNPVLLLKPQCQQKGGHSWSLKCLILPARNPFPLAMSSRSLENLLSITSFTEPSLTTLSLLPLPPPSLNVKIASLCLLFTIFIDNSVCVCVCLTSKVHCKYWRAGAKLHLSVYPRLSVTVLNTQ